MITQVEVSRNQEIYLVTRAKQGLNKILASNYMNCEYFMKHTRIANIEISPVEIINYLGFNNI